MIRSAVCLVCFMVESPAQSGGMRSLIHPGPISGSTSIQIAAEVFPFATSHLLSFKFKYQQALPIRC